MDPEPSIAVVVNGCIKKFREILLTGEHVPEKPELSKIRPSLIDSRGRFKVWCGNLGAHKIDRSSLDHRLHDAQRTKASVLELIQELDGQLSNGQRLLFDIVEVFLIDFGKSELVFASSPYVHSTRYVYINVLKY